MTIPGGIFATGRVEIRVDRFPEAWDTLMGEWLPGSGYEPEDRLCYEVHLNDPDTHPDGKSIVELREPIRSL